MIFMNYRKYLANKNSGLKNEKTTSQLGLVALYKMLLIFGTYSFVPSFDVLAFQTAYDPSAPSSYESFAH